jgi:hypothetical protein
MVRKITTPAESDALSEVVANLTRGGASKFFYLIHRKLPHQARWDVWQTGIPVGDVDDVREYVFKSEEGADGYDYKVKIVDTEGNSAKQGGKQISAHIIPALRKTLHAQPATTVDPLTKTTLEMLAQRRQEMALRAQQIQLEREEKRLARMEKGEDGEEEQEYYPWNPMMGMGGMYPGAYPFAPFQQQHQQQGDSIAAAAIKALGEVAAAKQAPKDDGTKMLEILLPIILANGRGLEPKDMLGMMTPLFETMAKSQGDANRFVLENASEGNRLLMEKMLDMMKLGGEPEEEIEKYRKYMNLATEGLGKVAQVVFNRQSLLPGRSVDVPRLPGPARPKPAQPARAQTTPPAPPTAGAGVAAETAPQGGPTPPAASQVDAAKQIIAQRVNVYLLAHEESLLTEVDPSFAADQMEDPTGADAIPLWPMLPASLREKVLASNTAGIYEAFAAYDKEVVERILAAVAEDASGRRKQWCEDFWGRVKEEPEPDEDEGEGEGDDGGDDAPPTP